MVAPGAEREPVDELIAAGLAEDGDDIAISGRGLALFQPLRAAVMDITAGLVADLRDRDLDIARRVLETMTQRAARLLAPTPPAARG